MAPSLGPVLGPCGLVERDAHASTAKVAWDKDCATLGIDPNFNSLHNNKISDILKHNFWNILDNSIKSKKGLGTCSFNCGTSNKAKLNILGKNPVKYNAIS